jgi:uroporphyrinogen-III synthase
MSNSSIFISRNQDDVLLLQCFCEMHNLKLISKSLIEFNKTAFILPKKWDVLFFPSPRAVDFFFNQFTFYDFSDKKIACAGKGTALMLKQWVNKVDFVPENSGKINEVQLEFNKWLGDRNVLFVGSNQSKKSVLANIPQSQRNFIQVYETNFKTEKIAPCHLYIFSSPSNVKSFLLMNKIPEHAEVISWGQSTTNELNRNGVIPIFELKSSDISELIQYLKAFLNK